MRAMGLKVGLLGALLPLTAAAASTSYQPPAPTYVRADAALSAPHYLRSGVTMAPPREQRDRGSSGYDHGGRDNNRNHFHRQRGVEFVYSSMYSAQPGPDDVGSNETGSDDNSDRPETVRTEYVPVPYPVVVAPPAPPVPRPRPPIVRYATTGEPIDIPKGARVTTGSVYRYKNKGVSVYTDAPPPASAHATLLFGYTEAVAPAPPADH